MLWVMSKTRIVRQLRHGQITIPKEFRDALRLESDDMLAVTLRDGKLELETVNPRGAPKTVSWLKELYDLYEPAREEIASRGLTEDEIHGAIDAAIREVRAEHRQNLAD